LKIWGVGASTCTQRVLFTLLENGATDADFEIAFVDVMKGEHKQATHLKRQPFGLIPALEDSDGFTLYESRAIARYVNETRGGKLTPKTIRGRALMEQWLSLEATTLSPDLGGILVQRVFAAFKGLQPDAAKASEHAAKLAPSLDVMEAHLAKNTWLAGEEFSLADVDLAPYFAHVVKTPEADIITSRPHVAGWWKRVSERPAWIKALSYGKF